MLLKFIAYTLEAKTTKELVQQAILIAYIVQAVVERSSIALILI